MGEIKATPNHVKSIMLNRLNYGTNIRRDQFDLVSKGNPLKIEVEALTDEMAVSLTKDVYGMRRISSVETTVKVPENWKESIKESLGFKFKTREIKVSVPIDICAIFPEIKGVSETITYNLKQ